MRTPTARQVLAWTLQWLDNIETQQGYEALLDAMPSNGPGHNAFRRILTDELNGNRADYKVSVVHLDAGDYLKFVRVDPTKGVFWQDQEEGRQEMERAIREGATGEGA
jgi:hypothetical protein